MIYAERISKEYYFDPHEHPDLLELAISEYKSVRQSQRKVMNTEALAVPMWYQCLLDKDPANKDACDWFPVTHKHPIDPKNPYYRMIDNFEEDNVIGVKWELTYQRIVPDDEDSLPEE
ncbi:MAG: hypothetical protein IJ251_05120 [Oscillospiraceae bacterium]|nr:hypothetical protein [Oscillospiraceae bacterium]